MDLPAIEEHVLAPATGIAVEVAAGQRIRVTDIEGLQVVDMAVFNRANLREKLSCAYSRTRAGTAAGGAFHPRDRLSVGDVLMSTINREMMRITADTPEIKGMHDVHGRMCNRALYEALEQGPKDGCHEIIAGPGATRVSDRIWWKDALVGSTSTNETVPDEKFATAMRRRFGANARSIGSDILIVSSTVMRLLLTTRICWLSPSRM